MVLRFQSVTFDVADAAASAAFWAGLLGREILTEPDGALLPGDETQEGLRFVTSDTVQIGPRQLHLHLTSRSVEHQQQIVREALRLGGRHLDVGQGPDVPFVVLVDPGGDELCVIEPGNGYLAGTGALGEVTCDGAPEVGRFWRDALGWPLVLNSDGQTAVQSPRGGTKISWDAWEEAPPPARNPRLRQRFDLEMDDLAGEAERLVALGATRRSGGAGRSTDRLEMADPGGKDFTLRLVG